MKQSGTTKKHAGSQKHHMQPHRKPGSGKHNPQHQPIHHQHHHHHHAKPGKPGKAAKTAKPKQLALAEGVACCSAEALAASLRLSGWHVTNADVYRLHVLAGGHDDHGATIQDTLMAAQRFGLAGVRLETYWPTRPDAPLAVLGLELPDHAVCADYGRWWTWGRPVPAGYWPGVIIDEAWELRWDL